MLRIVFFTENKWAFGTIHHSLCKLLYAQGINAEILDFFQQYSADEMRAIADRTDYFVTTPVGVGWLLNYGISPQQIKSVAHAQWDLLLSIQQTGLAVYDQLAGYAVVSNILQQKSAEFGITRIPVVTHVGIEFNRFYTEPSARLSAVGFAGALTSRNFAGEEIKRGNLVQQICADLALPLRLPQYHYLAMPSYYATVDCVIQASTEEGAGLPMMEAAAAGKFVLGTPVGYFEENVTGGGIQVPVAADDFVHQCKQWIVQARCSDHFYTMMCRQNQEYAREHYDWAKYLQDWVNFLY